MNIHDTRDGEDLMRVLRDEVIPLYYSATVTAFHAVGSSA